MKVWPCLALLLLGLLAVPTTPAQVESDKALATFKVSPGLEVQLWASEPAFVNPTCMDIDPKGRVWVVESVNYRCELRKKPLRDPRGDRILILEDTRGSGKADKVTVFYQAPDILAPLGIAVAPHPNGVGYTVYVGQSPNILVFEDKYGRGIADGPPRKLLTGFQGVDHDHGVHGLLIGPDNKLYFTVGDQGVKNLVDRKGQKWSSNASDCRAGTVWRCDLDGKNLELLAHNFRNHYEPCVDSFGTIFVSDNDDDGNDMCRICYVMPGGNYGYHPRGPGQTHWHEEQPGIVPMLLRTFRGAPTGMCFYEGQLLPEKYWGQPLHTDAGPGRLTCYHAAAKGASYTLTREDILTSSDSWYRPSDVCVAPDGAVFVADWYDPGVGGHGIGDFTRGRIYRVAPTGNKPGVPDVDMDSDAGIRKALGSPNLATRHMAMVRLNELPLPRAVEVLTPGAVQKKDPVLRARTLWQLGRLGNLKYVSAAFSDPDPRFRILSMRILSDFHNLSPADYIPDWHDALLADSSAAVRREALLLLRETDAARAKTLIYELARLWDGKDRFYLAAIGIAVGQDGARREVLLKDFGVSFPGWDPKIAGLVWELRPPQVVNMVGKYLSDPKTPAPDRLLMVDILAGSADPAAPAALLKIASEDKTSDVRERVIEALKKNLRERWASFRSSPELKKTVQEWLGKSATAAAAVEIVGTGMDGFEEQVAKIALDAKADLPVRLLAVRALGNLKETQLALLDVVGDDAHCPVELRAEAALALGKHASRPGIASHLRLTAQDKQTALPVRQAAVASLSTTKAGCDWLLDAQSAKQVAGDLDSDLSRLLRNSPFPDVRKKAEKVFPAPPPLDPKSLPSIPALLARKGSVERGKKLIAASLTSDAQCLKCHTISGVGGKVGPDLSTIGSKASRENLLESILYPSRAIADQYQQYLIETKNGIVVNGLIIEESKQFVLLRDANGKDYKFAQDDVDSKKRVPTSLMPELVRYLSEQDLLDIVDYMATLKNQPGAPLQ
jgi:putative membrane-bound dehydrogenase-like protein